MKFTTLAIIAAISMKGAFANAACDKEVKTAAVKFVSQYFGAIAGSPNVYEVITPLGNIRNGLSEVTISYHDPAITSVHDIREKRVEVSYSGSCEIQATNLVVLEESAGLSFQESEQLMACAVQFNLIKGSDVGEHSGLVEVNAQYSNEGTVRVYKVILGDGNGQLSEKGFLQIDVQGDVSQVDDYGKFLRSCG